MNLMILIKLHFVFYSNLSVKTPPPSREVNCLNYIVLRSEFKHAVISLDIRITRNF